ncbi:histidine utilization repressor [Rhizobiaceae bacterium n13]|uniref:Histidine utilization repressor n=1 Tax=Ferirhizobium litorale TaxID=2927786 RepID=A0AAE3U258_9HYPH|nr:histidine utilization repressor [Fererhizobium litorale]MDI7862349.1 histidine utilization repressor [Fererhizobium litorale]MDI7922377.1 histidine utilization repressor [Fererhizobium litorale]
MTALGRKNEMATFEDGPVPRYEAVKQYIRSHIDSGEWPANHRIPSENEIVVDLGVSRMTANRALRELASEGAITRVQGVGSFVAARKGSTALLEVRNIADEIRGRGHTHTSHLVEMQEEAAGTEIGDALGLATGARIFHSVMVHLENGLPIQIEDRYVNPVVCPRYMEQDFSAMTPTAYLTMVAPITRTEQIVEAVSAKLWECKLLGIDRTEPCLMIRRRTWSDTTNVTTARLLYPGTRYRLEGVSQLANG